MARYVESRGSIYDSETSRYMGPYSEEDLRKLNAGTGEAGTASLEEMTVDELHDLKSKGMSGYSSLNKADLITAIDSHAAEAETAEGGESVAGEDA